MVIIQERWEKILTLPLKPGAHSPDSTFCVMEAAAFVAGEDWTDHPKSVPPTIAAMLRLWNDRLASDADRDRLLKPFIPRIIGLPINAKIEMKRAILVGDWALRVFVPEYLRLANKADLADQLAAASESKTRKQLADAAKSVRKTLTPSVSAIVSASIIDSVSAIAMVSDIAIAMDVAIASAMRLEGAQSALIESMIECTE